MISRHFSFFKVLLVARKTAGSQPTPYYDHFFLKTVGLTNNSLRYPWVSAFKPPVSPKNLGVGGGETGPPAEKLSGREIP